MLFLCSTREDEFGMKEVMVSYQQGNEVKEIGVCIDCDSEAIQEVLNELDEETFIRFNMIDGRKIILARNTIISIIGREVEKRESTN